MIRTTSESHHLTQALQRFSVMDIASHLAELEDLFSPAVTREDAFIAACRAASALGFNYLIYAPVRNHPDSEKNWSATSYPQGWQRIYIEKDYLSRNPVRHRTLITSRPFSWSTLESELPRKEREIFSDCRDTGMNEGVVVPVHGPWGQAVAVGFASCNKDAADDLVIHTLQIIALRLHHCLDSNQCTPPTRLTAREQEILLRVAEGRDNGEISTLLSIAEGSVEWHLGNVFRKLGVRNRTAAVIKAIQVGLLAL